VIGALQIRNRVEAFLLQTLLRDFANAPDHPHRLIAQKIEGFGFANHSKAAWLIQIGRHLCEEFAIAQTH
jgi:endonuclease III